jgi:hypothetical protein
VIGLAMKQVLNACRLIKLTGCVSDGGVARGARVVALALIGEANYLVKYPRRCPKSPELSLVKKIFLNC